MKKIHTKLMVNSSSLVGLIAVAFIFLYFNSAAARPEYAAREKSNCIQCHVSPWGAGHRRVAGKVYGSRELEEGTHSDTDRYYADFRALYFKDTKKPNRLRKNGLGFMTGQVSAFVPVLEKESGYNTSVLGSYDFGAFQAGPRETYALWEYNDEKWFMPSSILLGRFYLPFGLLSDEHRTYTRMQTSTSLRDYEMGGVLSFDPLDFIHFDFGYMEGFGTLKGVSKLSSGETYGLIANLRVNPDGLPVMLGASWLYHNTNVDGEADPYAWSFYGVISLDQLIHEKFKASLLTEVVTARYLNDTSVNAKYMNQIIPSSALSTYGASVKDKTSRGLLAEFKWELTPQWMLLYKFDHLILDDQFTSDAFMRHGFGFRYQFNANTLLTVKYEEHNITVPSFENVSANTVDQSDIIAILRLWL